jgi:hypothetical protein
VTFTIHNVPDPAGDPSTWTWAICDDYGVVDRFETRDDAESALLEYVLAHD